MKSFPRRQVIQLLAGIEDTRAKGTVIRKWLELAKQGMADFSENDLADFVAADVDAHYEEYKASLDDRLESAALIRYFYDDPSFLARALVRMYPEIFYMDGFAHRFVLKLHADLGPVLRQPSRASGELDMAAFMDSVPKAVQADLIVLDRERRFRDYLYLFSRDPAIGFEELEKQIGVTTDAYAKGMLQELHSYCHHLFRMTFPDFVPAIDGSLFPSFHVRWWIDSARNVKRILNMGDTGTQKTAFAVVAAHSFGCRQILVLCPPHARRHWESEIGRYFQEARKRTYTLRRRLDAEEMERASADYTIVAYTAITEERVRNILKGMPFDALIWDESHYGKSVVGAGSSQRARACAELVQAIPLHYILALSATPWENHPGELAAIATVLRPDLFQDANMLHRTRSFDPRFLRELFAAHILEVELHEVVDLPPIRPKPWQDLFGIELLDLNDAHRAVYEFVRENTTVQLASQTKVLRLLLAAIHPHCLEDVYDWPENLRCHFKNSALSTKLMWIKERVSRELQEGAKVVIGTGIYVSGITRPQDDEDEAWVGANLRQWFGEGRVLILDGATSQVTDRNGLSKREAIIRRWRNDPNARILLVSIRTCPDSINLSVPALPGVTKLFLTTLSFPWVPWKQFLGRFWRSGLGVPFSYAVPVLRATVDESLCRLVGQKWSLQQLFRAQVPLTKRELALFDQGKFIRLLVPDSRSSFETVNFTGGKVRECDECQMQAFLNDKKGEETNAERFAKAFVKIQELAAPGHIARFMRQVILELEKNDLVKPSGILDAGCGPLTLERMLEQPVHGVDMNESILRIGKELSPLGGVNSQVGLLTRLPPDWQHRFELTVASLVVDWASLRKLTAAKVPIRVALLQELVRVTHKTGRVWLTFTRRSLTPSLLDAWCAVLKRHDYQVLDELTGFVEAIDCRDSRPFAFWSICFCPEGKPLSCVRDGELSLEFEQSRIIEKRGKERKEAESYVSTNHAKHEQFVVRKVDGRQLSALEAAQRAAAGEQTRLARLANVPWRSLVEMRRRGINGDLV